MSFKKARETAEMAAQRATANPDLGIKLLAEAMAALAAAQEAAVRQLDERLSAIEARLP
ncbi:hypothetical protein [Cupriavidus agavae]|uniref:hypothetical protein n=1 Tax=Cupriavidus agavae TaxID=1001822 RepID=UPI0013003EBF|nr:hypothetical protein [Cupriavidus agavae]